MCTLSVVTDMAYQQWGHLNSWPLPESKTILDVLRKLDEMDKKLGAPECVDDRKDDFIRRLEQRIEELERKLAENGSGP